MKNRTNFHQGFTLLELLVVISIIGILVTMALAAYSTAQMRARNSKRIDDMKAIQNGMEQYYSDHNAYPLAASCNPGVLYLPAGFPSEIKSSWDPYSTTCETDLAATPPILYCACARLEPSGNTNGNASDLNCGGNSGEYYCVKNLQ
jgi:prepilin-type N-terminal cleavage/methylation domain-containing protein